MVCVEAVWFHGEAVELAVLEEGTGRHWAKEILLRRRTSLLHHGSRHATGLHGGAVHQENVGWSWGFGIPAIGMLISTVLFLVRYSIYVLLKPGSSLFTRIAQVVAAAFRKRREEARRKSRGI